MKDLPAAIVAAREALRNSHATANERPHWLALEAAMSDLLAALDAAQGEAVAWSRDEFIYDDEGRAIGTDEVQILWRTRPDPCEGWEPLYAAPPAAVPSRWSGWAIQYPGKLPKLYGAEDIARLNWSPEEGADLVRVVEVDRVKASEWAEAMLAASRKGK